MPSRERKAEGVCCGECGLPFVECSAVAMARLEAERWMRDEGYKPSDARKRSLELIPIPKKPAMPEEGCGEADLNWAIRPIRPPAPISSEEGWQDELHAVIWEAGKCAEPIEGCPVSKKELAAFRYGKDCATADIEVAVIEAVKAIVAAPPVAASPTGVGEE